MVLPQSPNDQKKIIQLEETIAHQINTIEELSNTVAEQWLEIDKINKKLNALTNRFIELEEAAGSAPENIKPPHY